MTDADLKAVRADLAALKVIVHEIDRKISPPPKIDQPNVVSIVDALERAGWDGTTRKKRK